MHYMSRARVMAEGGYTNKRASTGRNRLQLSDMRGLVHDKQLTIASIKWAGAQNRTATLVRSHLLSPSLTSV